MVRYDDTDTSPIIFDYDDTSTAYPCGIFTEEVYDDEPCLLEAERVAVRSGWNNPRKINILKKYLQKHISICIRNNLPYKLANNLKNVGS